MNEGPRHGPERFSRQQDEVHKKALVEKDFIFQQKWIIRWYEVPMRKHRLIIEDWCDHYKSCLQCRTIKVPKKWLYIQLKYDISVFSYFLPCTAKGRQYKTTINRETTPMVSPGYDCLKTVHILCRISLKCRPIFRHSFWVKFRCYVSKLRNNALLLIFLWKSNKVW